MVYFQHIQQRDLLIILFQTNNRGVLQTFYFSSKYSKGFSTNPSERDATEGSKAFFFKKIPEGHYKDSLTSKCHKGSHILQIIARGHSKNYHPSK